MTAILHENNIKIPGFCRKTMRSPPKYRAAAAQHPPMLRRVLRRVLRDFSFMRLFLHPFSAKYPPLAATRPQDELLDLQPCWLHSNQLVLISIHQMLVCSGYAPVSSNVIVLCSNNGDDFRVQRWSILRIFLAAHPSRLTLSAFSLDFRQLA